MNQQLLYLFVGYPGAGKTTAAQYLAQHTGAVHIWADHERHAQFPQPQHTLAESEALYERLNQHTGWLLKSGKNVIFDTNFNFYNDRQRLRDIAAAAGALTVLIWIQTPLEVAAQRAVHSKQIRNGYSDAMSHEQFTAITSKLEPPLAAEQPIIIDGTKLETDTIDQQMQPILAFS